MGNEALQKANDEWVGCWDQNLPDCLKTASGHFYDEKNVIPKRKKFWKIIFDVRTTPASYQWSRMTKRWKQGFLHMFINFQQIELENCLRTYIVEENKFSKRKAHLCFKKILSCIYNKIQLLQIRRKKPFLWVKMYQNQLLSIPI